MIEGAEPPHLLFWNAGALFWVFSWNQGNLNPRAQKTAKPGLGTYIAKWLKPERDWSKYTPLPGNSKSAKVYQNGAWSQVFLLSTVYLNGAEKVAIIKNAFSGVFSVPPRKYCIYG
jgi:hypothetical protein